jgi:hypothetical protein
MTTTRLKTTTRDGINLRYVELRDGSGVAVAEVTAGWHLRKNA